MSKTRMLLSEPEDETPEYGVLSGGKPTCNLVYPKDKVVSASESDQNQ